MDGSATKKIVLLGKTGSGKSSLANTIFEETLFKVNHSLNSETKTCETKTKLVHGHDISLIDTPGFFDTRMTEDDLKSQIVKCIVECASGVHAFPIVLKWEKFTEQEQDVINKIHSCFSDEALKYAVVVFTHGDQLPEEKKIEEFISQNKSVSDLVEKCGGRCHVIDNKYWNKESGDEYRTNQFQVKAILDTVNSMVTGNGGKVYTNEMLKEVDRLLQQANRESSESLSREEIRNKAKEKVFEILKYAATITTGVLLGALLGVAEMIVKVVKVLRETEPTEIVSQVAAGDDTGLRVAQVTGLAVKGAIDGGELGYNEAENAKTVAEAVNNTVDGCVKDFRKKTQKELKQKESKEEQMYLLKK